VQVTVTTGEVSVDLRAVQLSGGRLAAPVPPELGELVAGRDPLDPLEVTVVVVDGEERTESPATASVVRSGRAWTEARGRLRERRGWARRFARAPAEVVLISPQRSPRAAG
jgi:hypothetical protein